MNKYEMMVILDADSAEEVNASVIERLKTIISEKGTVESVDEWGKRKFAYTIDYKTEGYYVLFNFEAEPEVPAELQRICNITESVVRCLVVCKDEK